MTTTNNPKPTCSEIVDKRIESFPFNATREEALTWVEEHYDITPAEIHGGLSANGTGYYYYWKVDAKRYDLTGDINAAEPPVVGLIWENKPPSVNDILYCLGHPALYRSYYAVLPEAIWTYLELWYPERGIMVTIYITDKVSSINNGIPIAYVSYVKPGSLEKLLPRIFRDIAPGSERYFQILHNLRPWPDDITKITIDETG